jgi:hypothetical protein
MSKYEQQQGALERLSIPVETIPPENVMTAGQAHSVRFRVSSPSGYAYGDVESFLFDHIQPTLEWYADALHARDLAIHKLGELVDQLEVDQLNLSAQLDNKQLTDTLNMAVDEADKEDETDALLGRIRELEGQLSAARAQLDLYAAGGVTTPEGEFFTREEVEGYIEAAVVEAVAQREQEFADAGYYTQAEVQEMLAQQSAAAPAGFSQEQVDVMLADALAAAMLNAPAEDTFSRDEVESFIASAVAEAEAKKDEEFSGVLAEQTANQAPAGVPQDEVERLISAAVTAKEAEIMNNLPEPVVQDEIEQLTDEGDLKLRAEVKTLRTALREMTTYAEDMEKYVAELDGSNVVAAPVVTQSGRPLPKLTLEDL